MTQFLVKLKSKKSFNREEIEDSMRTAGFHQSHATFCKALTDLVKAGELIRIGRGLYAFPCDSRKKYDHEYSALSIEVAKVIHRQYPQLRFTIFESIQLNEFANHQIAHNIIFLSVENDAMPFVFDSLKEKYPGKVLIHPTKEIYNQYWTDNMIVINKLVTEAPKSAVSFWHTTLEKLLVDIKADDIISDSISEKEYISIIQNAFSLYIIDESCLFRYASRRTMNDKIKIIIKEETSISLNIKR